MDFLKSLFTEPLSFEAFSKAVEAKGIKLANLADGNYVALDKHNKALGELKTANDTIKTLTDEVQTLNASAEDWKKKFDDLTADIKKKDDAAKAEAEDKALTDAIVATFGDKKFTSDYVKNGIIADMKTEIAKPENKGKGYTEILDALTKDKEGIFANPNPPGDMAGMNSGELKITDNQARAVMGLPPLKE